MHFSCTVNELELLSLFFLLFRPERLHRAGMRCDAPDVLAGRERLGRCAAVYVRTKYNQVLYGVPGGVQRSGGRGGGGVAEGEKRERRKGGERKGEEEESRLCDERLAGQNRVGDVFVLYEGQLGCRWWAVAAEGVDVERFSRVFGDCTVASGSQSERSQVRARVEAN